MCDWDRLKGILTKDEWSRKREEATNEVAERESHGCVLVTQHLGRHYSRQNHLTTANEAAA